MADELCDELERKHVLSQVPQGVPFLFIDEVLELSKSHIVATYRFRGDEFFYAGHFPQDPVTPGVILIEAMAQAGLVALGIHLADSDGKERWRTLFSDCSVEFLAPVKPGEKVNIRAEKTYWRLNKLQSKVELRLENGELAAFGKLSGVGVRLQ